MINSLRIKNLGPIGDINIKFGDLTLIVGPQATGKSLALETLKLAVDRSSIIDTLNKHNYNNNLENILNVYYGEGLGKLWQDNTEVQLDNSSYTRETFPLVVEKGERHERMFYIPAQRVMSVQDGAGKSFDSFGDDAPYVNRKFGEVVQRFIQNGIGQQTTLFPIESRLKEGVRDRLDKSIYHGAKVELEDGRRKKMVLNAGGLTLPLMTWSAGQREFTPLLLGFYCLTGAPQNALRNDYYNYVVIEEPEMGLHPKAIADIFLQILELIQREKGPKSNRPGYQVIVSTHSGVFLDFVWAFNKIKTIKDQRIKYESLYELLEVKKDQNIRKMLNGILDKQICTYYFGIDSEIGRTKSTDISSLDVWDDNPIVSDWGELTSSATKATDVVSSNVLNYD
jgi:predicted ATP-binding protein involved in virulence